MLSDYGATVLRVDRSTKGGHSNNPPLPTEDGLTRRKTSIAVNLKSASGIALIKSILPQVDVVIDPFRPGVLEKLGLSPEDVLLKINPRLIVGRMTGFRRDGKYKDMAGHDINYIAVSGVLAMLGRKGEKPYPPGNIIGDFAGGGAMCFLGILLALLARERTGRGQVVEANMVDGSSYLATMPRQGIASPVLDQPRGENLLDTGCPYYDTYATRDGLFMAVGALELHFFHQLVKGLGLDTPAYAELIKKRGDRKNWPKLKQLITDTFKSKTRAEWEAVFDGTDACCTPVLSYVELRKNKFDLRPAVTLKSTPGFAISDPEGKDPVLLGQGSGVEGDGWESNGLAPGDGGEEVLGQWLGWKRGRQYEVVNGGLEKKETSKL